MYLIAHLSILKVPILSKVRLKRDKPPIQLEDKVCWMTATSSESTPSPRISLSLYLSHSPSPAPPSLLLHPLSLSLLPQPLLLHPLSLSLLPLPLPPFYSTHSHSVSFPSPPSLPSIPPLSLHLCNSGRHQLRFFSQRRGEGQ